MTSFYPVGRTDSSFTIISPNFDNWAALCVAVADYCCLELDEDEAQKRVDIQYATFEDSTFEVVTLDGCVVGCFDEALPAYLSA